VGAPLAYGNEDKGDIYVRPFLKVSAGRWQVSAGGSRWPLWSRDKRQLSYLSGGHSLMAVDVEATHGTFRWAGARMPSAGSALSSSGNGWPRSDDLITRWPRLSDDHGRPG